MTWEKVGVHIPYLSIHRIGSDQTILWLRKVTRLPIVIKGELWPMLSAFSDIKTATLLSRNPVCCSQPRAFIGNAAACPDA